MTFKDALDIAIRLLVIVLLCLSIYTAWEAHGIVQTVKEKVAQYDPNAQQLEVTPEQAAVALKILQQGQSS